MLSRFPWPWQGEHTKVTFDVSSNMERHLWLWPSVERFKNGASTRSTLVGVSTAFADQLGQAAARSIETLERLRIPEGQFRLDGKRVVEETLAPVVKAGLVRMVTRLG